MRVLITGGLGNIGSALLNEPRLCGKVDEVLVLDDLSTGPIQSLLNFRGRLKVRFLEGDVVDALSIDVLKGVDAVVHLAGATHATGIGPLGAPDKIVRNLSLTEHVGNLCQRASVPLIFTSSTSVYTSNDPYVLESSTEIHPRNVYAQTKLAEERYLRRLMDLGLRCTIFRFGTVFGRSAGMHFRTAVGRFCLQAVTHGRISVWRSALDQVRPYLHIGDAGQILAETVINERYLNTVVNAASCNCTVNDVVTALRNHIPGIQVDLIDSPSMNDWSFGVSVSLAASLGYQFHGSLDGGVTETLEALRVLT